MKKTGPFETTITEIHGYLSMPSIRSVRLAAYTQPKFGANEKGADAPALNGAQNAAASGRANGASANGHVNEPAKEAPKEPAKEPANKPTNKASNDPKRSSSVPETTPTLLAKTASYSMSIFPGRPPILAAEEHEGLTVDAELNVPTQYAALAAGSGVYAWHYAAAEVAPTTLFFDADGVAGGLAVMVPPMGTDVEPGLVILARTTGTVTYWESLGRSVADGLVKAGTSAAGQVHLKGGEVLLLAEYVASGAVVVSTSHNRQFLVTLRNPEGKPTIASVPLSGGRGGLLGIKDALVTSGWKRNIVAIASGDKINDSERRVYFINAHGDLAVWNCGSTGTVSLVQETPLMPLVYAQVHLLYDNPVLVVHDMTITGGEMFLLLSTVRDNETQWIVATLEVPSATTPQFLIKSLHRLQTYTSDGAGPAHLVAGHAAILAVFQDAVVLVARQPPQQNTPRFEDVIRFKNGVRVYGAAGSSDAFALVTSAGVLSLVPGEPPLQPSSALGRLERAVLASPSSPLDLAPSTPLGSQATVEAAVRTLVGKLIESASQPSASVHASILRCETQLVRVSHLLDNVPGPDGEPQTAIGTDQRWWLVEQIAVVAAAAALTATTSSAVPPDMLSHVEAIPGLLINLLGRDANAAVQALKAADDAYHRVGHPAKFPTHCPWLASRELLTALEAAVHRARANLLPALVELLCATYQLRHAYLQASEPAEAEELASSTRTDLEGLLAKLAGSDTEAAVRIAERFAILQPLARILCEQWLKTQNDKYKDQLLLFIDRFGYGFAEALFDCLCKAGRLRNIIALATGHQQYLSKYVTEHNLYNVEWVLDFMNNDLAGAATVLQGAAKKDPEAPLDRRQLMASFQKLCALEAGAGDLVTSANSALAVVGAQRSLQAQFHSANSYLWKGERPGVAALVEQLFSENKALSVDGTIDLLTFVPLKAPGSEDNYAQAVALAPIGARLHLLAQQLVLHNDWAAENILDTLAGRTLSTAPHSETVHALVQPQNWRAPTDAATIAHLYPDAPSTTVTELANDFQYFNSQVDSICQAYDVPGITRQLLAHLQQGEEDSEAPETMQVD